jgi:hypothetical protein
MPLANISVVSLALLTPQVTIDSNTASVYVQISFSLGYYNPGGLASGVQAFVSALTVDDEQFLQAIITSEATFASTASLPSTGGFQYIYNPTTDKIQVVLNGVELTASETMPAGVLNDVIVGKFTYLRGGL